MNNRLMSRQVIRMSSWIALFFELPLVDKQKKSARTTWKSKAISTYTYTQVVSFITIQMYMSLIIIKKNLLDQVSLSQVDRTTV